MSIRGIAKWLDHPQSFVHTLSSCRMLMRNWPVLLLFNRHVIRRYPSYHLRNGMKYTSVGFSDWGPLIGVWIDGIYNPRGFEISKGDIVVDVGAHSGAFSLYASERATAGAVYAFEPHPRTYEILSSNIRRNGVGNVETVCAAISDSSGVCRLYVSDNDLSHSIKPELADGSRGKYYFVESLTLQDVLTRFCIKRIDFLKLNCEGAEYAIIRSASDDVLDNIGKIVVQYHEPDCENGIESLRTRLESRGFQVTEPSSGAYRILYAVRTGGLPRNVN